jgi:hypothetical protein
VTAKSDIKKVVAEVQAIYADLESRPLPRTCLSHTECCRFKLTGKIPHLTKGEAITAAAGWRAVGRKSLPHPASSDGACPFLAKDKRCAIYTHRPFGCRTHFCAPAGGPYPRDHVLDLIRKLETLDERLHGTGPRTLPNALADAWPLPK